MLLLALTSVSEVFLLEEVVGVAVSSPDDCLWVGVEVAEAAEAESLARRALS